MEIHIDPEDLRLVLHHCLENGVQHPVIRNAVFRLSKTLLETAGYVYRGHRTGHNVDVIKAYRRLSGANLKFAKNWAEEFPRKLQEVEGIPLAEMVKILRDAGAIIE